MTWWRYYRQKQSSLQMSRYHRTQMIDDNVLSQLALFTNVLRLKGRCSWPEKKKTTTWRIFTQDFAPGRIFSMEDFSMNDFHSKCSSLKDFSMEDFSMEDFSLKMFFVWRFFNGAFSLKMLLIEGFFNGCFFNGEFSLKILLTGGIFNGRFFNGRFFNGALFYQVFLSYDILDCITDDNTRTTSSIRGCLQL